MPLCPYCHTVVSQDTRFCPECGRPLVAGEVVVGEAGKGKSKKKLAAIVVACTIAIIAAIVLFSTEPWERAPSAEFYVLTTVVSPSGAGFVSPSGGECASGLRITLTAMPLIGYTFDYWDGAAPHSSNTVTITMSSNKTITAHFKVAEPPTPKFTTPDTGAIIGQVMFPDSRPAYGTVVYIFKGEETSSYAADYADVNGYYMFDDLPPERYSLYTASYATIWGFTKEPAATVTVLNGVATTPPTLTQSGNIVILLDNPRIATMPALNYTSKCIIDGHNPKFTWNGVQNAAYYVIGIVSTGTEEHPLGAYNETQKVVTDMIVWPTTLSSLPYQEFYVDVEAHTKDDILIASGREWFAVDNPPTGWVFK